MYIDHSNWEKEGKLIHGQDMSGKKQREVSDEEMDDWDSGMGKMIVDEQAINCMGQGPTNDSRPENTAAIRICGQRDGKSEAGKSEAGKNVKNATAAEIAEENMYTRATKAVKELAGLRLELSSTGKK